MMPVSQLAETSPRFVPDQLTCSSTPIGITISRFESVGGGVRYKLVHPDLMLPSWHWRRWTDQEKRILVEKYPVVEDLELRDLVPNRSIGSMIHIASQLDLVSPRTTYGSRLKPHLRLKEYREKLSETEIAYLAGIFDWEGTLSVNKDKYGYHVYTGIVNTNRALVDWLVARLGAKAYKKKDKPRGRQTWSVRFGHGRAYGLLRLMLPYLIIKKRHAELFLAYAESRMNDRIGTPVSKEQLGYPLKNQSATYQGREARGGSLV